MASEEYEYPENIREVLLKISLTSRSDDVKDLPDLDVMKSDYFNMDFQKSKQVSGNGMVLGKYAGASQNQNPYDLIANYSPQAQELLKKWVRLALVPTKSRGKKVSTYSVKHWAEGFFQSWDIKGADELTYVSTGAMKGALMCEGFGLKPYQFNAYVNVNENKSMLLGYRKIERNLL